MTDVVAPIVRSRMMAAIGSKHTKPEMILRRGLHRLGYRFRLHDASLPGRPDLVFPRFGAIIEVYGCYWHGHGCAVGHHPASNLGYWSQKIATNVARDTRNRCALEDLGWRVLVIWECAVRGKARLSDENLLSVAADWLEQRSPSMVVKGG